MAAAVASGDGLDELNAKRATRGMRPYIRDAGLTAAAFACAEYRARHLTFGHTSNDFGFLPPGVRADSAGCAAYPESYGWLSCEMWESHSHAGAAWVMGRDGRRFMHVFIRNGGPAAAVEPAPVFVAAPNAPGDPYGVADYGEFYRRIADGNPGRLAVGVPDPWVGTYHLHCRVPSGFRGLADGEYACAAVNGVPQMKPVTQSVPVAAKPVPVIVGYRKVCRGDHCELVPVYAANP